MPVVRGSKPGSASSARSRSASRRGMLPRWSCPCAPLCGEVVGQHVEVEAAAFEVVDGEADVLEPVLKDATEAPREKLSASSSWILIALFAGRTLLSALRKRS